MAAGSWRLRSKFTKARNSHSWTGKDGSSTGERSALSVRDNMRPYIIVNVAYDRNFCPFRDQVVLNATINVRKRKINKDWGASLYNVCIAI